MEWAKSHSFAHAVIADSQAQAPCCRDESLGASGRGLQRARVPSTAAPMISAAASAMPGVSARPVASISSVVDATGVM